MIITRLIAELQEEVLEVGDEIEVLDVDYRIIDVITNDDQVEYALEAIQVVEPTLEELQQL